MRKLFSWFRSHPFISTFGGFLALFVAAHFFLNWQAERHWQAYVKEGRARGVKFDLIEFAPPKIPAEENFAALPMMRAIMQPGAKSPMALPETDRPSFGNPLKGERLDWVKWQTFFKDSGFISEITNSAPRDVLRALEHYSPQFQEWSQWKTRPKCRFDLDFKAGAAMPLPHLGLFQNSASLFALRMRAHLALGDSAAATVDFVEGFQAYRALVEEPTAISGLVRLSVLAIFLNGIAEGLADHAWVNADLLNLDANFGMVRVWEDYQLSFSSERGFANWLHETIIEAPLKRRINSLSGITAGPTLSPLGDILLACAPQRFYRESQMRSNRYIDEMLASVIAEGTRYNPDHPMLSGPEHLSRFDEYSFFLFRLLASVYPDIRTKYVLAQTKLDQLHLAIALERFRIANGVLPEKLDELLPEFLPALPDDIYSGKPMVYRRKEGGGFFLYSVGPNRIDDGGTIVPRKSEQGQPDWIWLYSQPNRKFPRTE